MPQFLRRNHRLTLALCAGLCAGPVSAQEALAPEGLAGAFLAAKVAISTNDFQAADLWYQRALQRAAGNAQITQGAMIAALAMGDLSRAAKMAQDLASLQVKDPAADLAKLAALAQANDFAGILQAQSEGANLGTLQDDLLAGWAHIGLGQMNDGLARLQKASLTPGLAGFGLYHQAIALALAGDFDGAAALLTAPEAAPLLGSRRGAIFAAQVLSQAGKFTEAEAVLRALQGQRQDRFLGEMVATLKTGQALPISGYKDASSGVAESFFSIASVLGDDTDPAYILLQARIASVLRPGDSEAVLLTASVLEKLQQYDLAAQSYGSVAQDSPDYVFAVIGQAEAVHSAGRKEDSLQILRDLVAARPQDFDAQLSLGHGLRRAELHAEAIATYDAAVALLTDVTPESWPLFYSRAISREATGDFTRAEADFRRALELNPDQPNVLNYLGYSLVDRGLKLEEALGMIQRAVAARPDAGYIVDSLAWAYFRLDRFTDALAPMEQAALLEPVDPVVTDHLGDVYWANGRKREAAFQWRRALSFNPTEKDAARIRLKLEVGLDDVRAREGAAPFPPVDGDGI